MNRLRAISLAVLASSCHVITSDGITGFKCDQGACLNGFTCCSDGYCRADCSGACTAGTRCDGNAGAPCKQGRTACPNAIAECGDGEDALEGTPCSGGNVCSSGACVPCVDGASCETNMNRCVVGSLKCEASGATCNDTAMQRPPGASCGDDHVCDPGGACIACKENDSCMASTLCKDGVIRCGSGARVCTDGPNSAAGTTCDTGRVCDGNGMCIMCVDGTSCGTNPDPCKTGRLSCSGGGASCADDQPKGVGAGCGMNKVCNAAGACVDCTADKPCGTNPSGCMQGITSCATGAETCVDSASPKTPGAACGMTTGRVCAPDAGCIDCSAGGACTGNSDRCRAGAENCTGGIKTCDNSNTPANPGQPCDGGAVCNNGFCGVCVQGTACTGNQTACRNGALECGTGVPTCQDSVGNRDAGTSCGTNKFCSPTGTCIDCTPGAMCTGNTNACRDPALSCSMGTLFCDNGADKPLGTPCTGGFCSAGSCVQCAIGGACTTNPGGPCVNGALARSGAMCVCNDSGNRAAGQVTGCTGAMTCNGMGACVACNQACNPGNVCQTGATSCQNLSCTMTGSQPIGQVTGCNGSSTCNGAGACVACNQLCAPANVCQLGLTSCADLTCVASGSRNVGQVTGCAGNTTCNGMGACVQCNTACQPAALCHDGRVNCGNLACDDIGSSPLGENASCHAPVTCDGLGNCVSCGGSCQPPSPCEDGTRSCTNLSCAFTGNRTGQFPGCDGMTTCNGSGQCVPCGQACDPGVECKTGTISCGNPAQCLSSGDAPNGTPCAGGVCNAGSCCTGCLGSGTTNGCNGLGCCSGFFRLRCGSGGEACFPCGTQFICDPGPPAFCDPF